MQGMSSTEEPLEGVAEDLQPEPAASGRHSGRRRRRDPEDGVRHTRISGAWTAVVVAVILGAALIDFIVQNTRSVRIEFFGASGQMPVAVAILGAALVGAVLVLTVGIARTAQLRIAARRGKRQRDHAESPATDPQQ
jgi:uncharacterized integral membrane protein